MRERRLRAAVVRSVQSAVGGVPEMAASAIHKRGMGYI